MTTNDEYLIHGNLQLRRGSMLRIDDGRGMLIHVWDGCLWVTQERDPEDILLRAGEWFRIARNGRTLVHATSASAVALTSPHEQAFARRIDLIRPGTSQPRLLHRAQKTAAFRLHRIAQRALEAWAGLYASPMRRLPSL